MKMKKPPLWRAAINRSKKDENLTNHLNLVGAVISEQSRLLSTKSKGAVAAAPAELLNSKSKPIIYQHLGSFMSNSMTEHSKKLRAKTAAAANKKALEEGRVRQIVLRMNTPDADEFDAVLAEFGGSRPQAIKALCAFYRQHQQAV